MRRRSIKQPWPEQFTVERWGYLPKSRAGRTNPPLDSPKPVQHMPQWCSFLGGLRLLEHIWVTPSRHWLIKLNGMGSSTLSMLGGGFGLKTQRYSTPSKQRSKKIAGWTSWRSTVSTCGLTPKRSTLLALVLWKTSQTSSVSECRY